MKKANLEDKSLVADILTAAFLHNKSVNYLIPQDGLKMFSIHELMQYSFEICLLFGEVFLCDDRKGRVLLLYPELQRKTFEDPATYTKLSSIPHSECENPLLLWTGKKDVQVNWHQSVDFYLAIRRLKKETIMLLYPE